MTLPAIFTDLDGTLLDAATYSFDPALPALAEAAVRGVPVVPCTTKTEAETRSWMDRLGLRGPFIFENGAGIALPVREFPDPRPGESPREAYRIVALAPEGARLQEGKVTIRTLAGGRVEFLGELSAPEVAARTGLPLDLAALARRRTFDEPFTCDGDLPADLPAAIAAIGLRLSRGGRFWHLHGPVDKGSAVRRLARELAGRLGPLTVVGAGDSALDRPLLEAADIAVAIPRPDGSFDEELCAGLPFLRRAHAPGPAGWNRAILDILRAG
ncbi:MAG: HAD hydrolase family protein [Planctomycetia bacterium]|nr:HAD hydrolase family protein [Planctomycetia bacterium]